MKEKKEFFSGLLDLLNEYEAKIVVKVDGKNNQYIGFYFPDSTYCCTAVDEINPKEKITFECEDKFSEKNGKTEYFDVDSKDNFTF